MELPYECIGISQYNKVSNADNSIVIPVRTTARPQVVIDLTDSEFKDLTIIEDCTFVALGELCYFPLYPHWIIGGNVHLVNLRSTMQAVVMTQVVREGDVLA
mmetsp:Transcript_2381/g.4456  ORF Transcript_2381/g.4456 Transcript_2381/m.4456 type:complete len:102 (+) Transcript_2381:203-508(+)